MEPGEKRARVATEPDVVLVCSDKEIVNTHRHKLVEVSPVFAAMLTGKWAEYGEWAKSGTVRVAFQRVVVKTFIEQISPFPPELEFCEYYVNWEIQSLCEMVHYYDVQPLAHKLQKMLLEIKQTPTSVKSFFEVAVKCDYNDLSSKCVESVTYDPAYFLLYNCGDFGDCGPIVGLLDNLKLLSYSEFQPAWQKLVELTGEYACFHPADEDPDLPGSEELKYHAPPVEALRLMIPFMFKCFSQNIVSQLPDGWIVKVERKCGIGTPYYFHTPTKKISYTRPQ
jgi:hypothetical protein